jgi:preprotein translocase subunit Sec63
MSPFEIIKAISSTKENILENEKDYNGFMVNRGLSYFPDTVIYANEMNKYHHLDTRLQFDFLINIVRKRNRFSKWNKSIESENISAIKKFYGYSNEKARDVLPLLSDENLKIIRGRIQHGGIQR